MILPSFPLHLPSSSISTSLVLPKAGNDYVYPLAMRTLYKIWHPRDLYRPWIIPSRVSLMLLTHKRLLDAIWSIYPIPPPCPDMKGQKRQDLHQHLRALRDMPAQSWLMQPAWNTLSSPKGVRLCPNSACADNVDYQRGEVHCTSRSHDRAMHPHLSPYPGLIANNTRNAIEDDDRKRTLACSRYWI